ncbi:hypothetical protein [Agrobacterium sp. FDAARGOS_525]|uniref:hypothetical protein n=1 Tax=Agrobacterium sp. FDAARGOS_525 TaxID=2420311 RepID=UPI00256EC472|nr:hypothetical protein [Agrobacterium sp. FDAARGOS_525]
MRAKKPDYGVPLDDLGFRLSNIAVCSALSARKATELVLTIQRRCFRTAKSSGFASDERTSMPGGANQSLNQHEKLGCVRCGTPSFAGGQGKHVRSKIL